MSSMAQQFTNLQTTSLREQSVSALQTAIRLPSDEGQILHRTNTVLALFYDLMLDAKTKADVLSEFVFALRSFPAWATQRAFDQWVKIGTHRPSPAHIVSLASLQIKAFTDELAYRNLTPEAPRERVSKEAAAEIMATAGFRPKPFTETAE